MSLFYTFIDFYYFFLNIDVVIKYILQYLVPVVLACCSNLAFAQSQFYSIHNSSKLSAVSRLAFSQNQQIKQLFVKDENHKFYALVQFNKHLAESELTDLSSLIIQKYGFIAQMRLTESEIGMLINDSRVDHIELSHKMNAPRLLNDKARVHSKVFQAQVYQGMQPSQLIRGKGVLVGIVDIGFQTDHPTFFNDNGTAYRVKRFWNQTSNAGIPPKLFPYGSLFSTENSILQAIDDDGTHGTHVAGISAGSGFQSPSNIYAGVAPDAALAFVSIKYANDTLKGSAKGDFLVANPTILDGFDYLIKYADSIKYPVTCNLSWGMHTGPHDGTSLFDLALENIVKQVSIWGGKPFGRSIIGANGNDGKNNMHLSLSLNNDTFHTLAMDRSRKNYPTEDVYCDFWSELGSNVQLKVSLVDSLNQEILSSPYFSMNQDQLVYNKLISGLDSLIYTLSFQKVFINNGKSNCLLSVQSSGSKRFIKLSFKGKGIVNGWNSGRTYEWTSGTFRSYINTLYPLNFVEGDATSTLGENGGTGKWITSVGAYTNRNEWVNFEGKTQGDKSLNVGQLAGFSSRGPSIDGRIKPDVAAPGQLIASAVHTRQVPGWIGNEILYKTQFNGKDVVWALFSGTSMAAPHVNGVAALVLQVAPNLNSIEMATVLRLSAQRDSFTTNDSNNNYGYGKVNALNAVKMALAMSSVSSLDKNDKPILLLKDNQLTIKNLKSINSTIELTVFDVTGKEIFKGNSNNSEFSTKLNISDGIYFFQLKSNHILSKGKVLLLN
jgi:subtilisin family serine protease